MKPNIKLAQAKTPDGESIALYEHDGSFCIRMNSKEIMHSRNNASELELGKLGARATTGQEKPGILIGGLGLGFTLRCALEHAPDDAEIQVAELIPEIVEWNKTHMKELNGKCLNDKRVKLLVKDAFEIIKNAKNNSYDSIILDTDNGPSALVQKDNHRLYSGNGLKTIYQRLKPGGTMAIWSAGENPEFVSLLNRTKFRTEIIPAKSHASAKRFNHLIFLAHKK